MADTLTRTKPARQTGSANTFLPLIDLFVLFPQEGVSQDAEHYGEAENLVTSCFAHHTF